ncbi:MAG: SHOCT domain-containing protein [Mucilaginibacter sp.]|uniref:SHOCT domain-containing protein n=1 Tax=Mucilaginibacter sp. TaxID=1882438 RepID=UPI003264345C
MKNLLLFFLLFPGIVVAQTLTEYKALNNKTYHVGDTVRLGKGSSPTGEFLYIQIGGFNSFLSRGHNQNIDKAYANTGLVIKKIKKGKPDPRSIEKLWFVVDGGGITTYNLYIDDAISACEVIPCGNTPKESLSVADEILKLKKLLDAGAITQKEYDAQKKKLLNQ